VPSAEDENPVDAGADEAMNANEPVYLQKVEEISVTEEPFLNIDCAHLRQFDADLYRQLICYPQVSTLGSPDSSCVNRVNAFASSSKVYSGFLACKLIG